MNREPEPCRKCARFLPEAQLRKAEDGPGYCEGFERPAQSADIPWACVLKLETGSKAHRRIARSEQEVLAELQRRHPETISRASALTTKTRDESHDDIATRP
jgi:hypothetical protein